MPEAELGSVCRSLCRLPIHEPGSLNEETIISSLQERLPNIDSIYVLESVCVFLSILNHPLKI
jgi:hypothetical protein